MAKWLSILIATASACGRVEFDELRDASPDTPPQVVAIVESETASVVPRFEIVSDATAVGGSYLRDGNGEGIQGPGSATVSFLLATSGTFYVWGRTLAPSTSKDSLFLSIDGATNLEYAASDCVQGPAWQWAGLRQPYTCVMGIAPLVALPLGAGTHSVRFESREGQTGIDRLFVTDDVAFVPND